MDLNWDIDVKKVTFFCSFFCLFVVFLLLFFFFGGGGGWGGGVFVKNKQAMFIKGLVLE